MKLAISNIGWAKEQDESVYSLMKQYGYSGIEIAPTRMFGAAPYEKIKEAREWSRKLEYEYGFSVPSIQSLWFGRKEQLFGRTEEREKLLDYTKKAIDFAAAYGSRNLVFGCPGNRCLPEGGDWRIAISFFRELGQYAAARGAAIGMEANPPAYHTNFVNTTKEALHLIREVDSDGFRLNLDLGAMIENGEDVFHLAGEAGYINHVHISEPGLMPLRKRRLHREIREFLEQEGYQGWVSVEIKQTGNIALLEDSMRYAARIYS